MLSAVGTERRKAPRGVYDPRIWVGTVSIFALVLTLVAGSALATPHPSHGAQPGAPKADTHPDPAPVRLGATDPARAITISVTIAGRSPSALTRTLAGIYDPRSPDFHHYLTPAEFAARFGATQVARADVEASVRAAGLTLLPSASSTSVNASGTVGQVEALFRVRLDDYRMSDGTRYFAPETAPQLPLALQGVATGVLGLDTRPVMHRASISDISPGCKPGASRGRTPRHDASGREPKLTESLASWRGDWQGAIHSPTEAGGFLADFCKPAPGAAGHPSPHFLGPRELDQAYHFGPLHTAGLLGENQTVAFAEIDTFSQSDIDTYDQHFLQPVGLSASPVQVVPVGTGAQPAKGGSETTLDIEVVHAVAPHATLLAYEGSATFEGIAQVFRQIVNDNRAQVVSISLGSCEPFYAQDPDGVALLNEYTTIFQQAATQGMTVLVATGDTGAYTCFRNDPSFTALSISVPADNPYVTAVGGTALFLNDDGSYGYEAGWESPLEIAGGGGGVSLGYPLPDWQTGPGVSNQYSTGKRQIPDVSAAADPLTGYQVYDSTAGDCSDDACWTSIGGTSAATPLWGALVALANQQAAKAGKKPVGFINPALYRMGRGELGPSPFHDITVGGNLYYQATQGWDYSTGWGTPDAALVVQELLSASSAPSSQPGP